MDKYPFDKGVAEYVDGLVEIKASGKLIATIPRDWQKYKKGGKRQGGYIGQGLSKYAFQVRLHIVLQAVLHVLITVPDNLGTHRREGLCNSPNEAH